MLKYAGLTDDASIDEYLDIVPPPLLIPLPSLGKLRTKEHAMFKKYIICDFENCDSTKSM